MKKEDRKRRVWSTFERITEEYIEDSLIFLGLFCIVYATFQIGKIAGFYCLGGCLLGLGVYFTRHPIRKE